MKPQPNPAVSVLILSRGRDAKELELALVDAGYDADVADPSHAAAAVAASAPSIVLFFADSTLRSVPDLPETLVTVCASKSTKVILVGATASRHAAVTCWPKQLATPELVRRLNEFVKRGADGNAAFGFSMRPTLPPEQMAGPPSEGEPSVRFVRMLSVSSDGPNASDSADGRDYCLVGADDCIYEVAPGAATYLGRGSENHIALLDRSVSRRHLSLRPTAAGLRLADCDSANGVRVNGVATREQVLSHGDCLQVGKFVFYVVEGNRVEAVKWRRARKPSLDAEDTLDDKTFRSARTNDMQGDLGAMDLLTLIQLLVAQRQSGTLALTRHTQPLGSVYFGEGKIVHAETPNGLTGVEAFYQLMVTQAAQFAFRRDLTATQHSIDEAPTALLLEGCRRLDEARDKASRKQR